MKHFKGFRPELKTLNKTTEEFIKESIAVWGDKYDYSLVNYENVSSKIKIICKIHGIFEQVAKNHKDGQGCPRCVGHKNRSKKEFMEVANKEEYD